MSRVQSTRVVAAAPKPPNGIRDTSATLPLVDPETVARAPGAESGSVIRRGAAVVKKALPKCESAR